MYDGEFAAATAEEQALKVLAAALRIATEQGLAEDAVALTLMNDNGVLTRTLAEVREEHAALSLRHLDFPVDLDPR